jgi:hypothetical protein
MSDELEELKKAKRDFGLASEVLGCEIFPSFGI